jgi:hypothetical protein
MRFRELLDHRDDLRWFDWFDQLVGDSLFQLGRCSGQLKLTGEHHDGNAWELGAEVGNRFRSIDLGHMYVANDRVNHEWVITSPDSFDSLLTILCLDHFEACFFPRQVNDLSDIGLIIYDEYSSFRPGHLLL